VNYYLLALFGFLFTFLFIEIVLRLSRRYSAYQAIREEGPQEHRTKKQHVPTMGGIAILVGVLLATAMIWNRELWVVLGTFLACGLLGLADDSLKIFRAKNLGLKARHKFIGQILIGVGLWFALEHTLGTHRLEIPFMGSWDAGFLYMPLVVFVLIATTNAVNLTDGLDGLASGVTAAIFGFFFIVSISLNSDPNPAYVSVALLGALLAFLWFNAFPAKIFMGDVGSLALGGALAALAFQTRLVFWLPLVGFMLVAETLSVILQVIYFKLTKGRRIFRMSPLHHHFELSGVPETQVTLRFWIVTFLLCWLGVLGALNSW